MTAVTETRKRAPDPIPGIDVCSKLHGAEYIVEIEGELYCRYPECGEQLQTPYTTGFEQRIFAEDGNRDIGTIRTGPGRTLAVHDYGLSTTIQPERGIMVSHGRTRKASAREYHQFAKLRYWQRNARVHSSEERNLAVALNSIGRYAEAQSLPKPVAESAALIYRKVLKKELVRGRSIEGMAAASLYIAARNHKNARGIADLASLSGTRKTLFQWYIRLILNELDLKPPRTSVELVPKILRKIQAARPDARIAPGLEMQTLEMYRAIKQTRYSPGKPANSLIASIIYIVSNRTGSDLDQMEIAKAADITDVTLRKRYQEIGELLKEIENKEKTIE